MDRAAMDTDPMVQQINEARSAIKDGAQFVKRLATAAKLPGQPRDGEDRGEVIANLMLAYRHLEDASMRLGKAIQARDGGTSVYDSSTTVGA